jgi:hypothetical protein
VGLRLKLLSPNRAEAHQAYRSALQEGCGRDSAPNNMTWPNGHKFAFTVVDDTDFASVDNVAPVYALLAELGMRTTKTAWMFRGEGPPVDGGATCEEPEYRDWLIKLQQQGFEIAFHNAAPCTSRRELTSLALAKFHELFGPAPVLFCNHVSNRENLYWGDARLSAWRRLVYNWATRGKRRNTSRGHLEGDPLFWGDLCQEHVRYVRSFVFDNLDALTLCPELPYHDRTRPYVNFWFTSADGGTLERFLARFTVQRLQRLEQTGGLCIAYVHFAEGFAENGRAQREFRKRLEFLASLDGWFVPASVALDHLRQGASTEERTISPERLHRLERRWLVEKLFKGTS